MRNENINTGNFTEQVTWQQPTAEKKSKGNTVRSFADYATCWMEVNEKGATEGEQAGRFQYIDTYEFTGHYNAEIDNTWQLVYNNQNYNIEKITPLNHRRFIRLTATLINE